MVKSAFPLDLLITKKDPKRLLNAANVMLECFGEFWIGGKNQIAIQSIKTENPINLSWTIFPKGEPIGERLVSEIAPCLKRVKPCQQPIVNKRVETIRKIFPDIKAIGNAGFFGYIVFFNPKKKRLRSRIRVGK